MSVTYGFDIGCRNLSEEEIEKFRAVLQDHPIGWVSGEESARENITVHGNYTFAYVESSCPKQFDDAPDALEDAVHRVWHALGRYVEVDAALLYIEDVPTDSIATDEDDYREWLAEGQP